MDVDFSGPLRGQDKALPLCSHSRCPKNRSALASLRQHGRQPPPNTHAHRYAAHYSQKQSTPSNTSISPGSRLFWHSPCHLWLRAAILQLSHNFWSEILQAWKLHDPQIVRLNSHPSEVKLCMNLHSSFIHNRLSILFKDWSEFTSKPEFSFSLNCLQDSILAVSEGVSGVFWRCSVMLTSIQEPLSTALAWICCKY